MTWRLKSSETPDKSNQFIQFISDSNEPLLRTRQKPLPHSHLPPMPAMESLWTDMDLLPAPQSRVESCTHDAPERMDKVGWFHDTSWHIMTLIGKIWKDQGALLAHLHDLLSFRDCDPNLGLQVLPLEVNGSASRSATKIMPKRQTWSYMEIVFHSNHSIP